MNAGMPWLSLDHEGETADGFHFVFASPTAIVFIPLFLVIILTFTFASHSALPLLMLLLVPFCFLRVVWAIGRDGPTLERRVTLFGRTLTRRMTPLQPGDAAYVEPSEDSALLTVRPRWYTLTVWSTVLGRDWVVMKSNQLDELERTAGQFNAAIQKVLARAA